MKTQEELKTLKNEIESLGKKLSELSEDELKEVTGGRPWIGCIGDGRSLLGDGAPTAAEIISELKS